MTMRQSLSRDQVVAAPYHWPHDASLGPETTALVIIDMQRDYNAHPLSSQVPHSYDVSDARAIIPTLQALLAAARKASFPTFFTREGHRPDLSTLPSRESFRSRNNPRHLGIGDRGPLGRFLIRGEPGHDVIPELKPLSTETVIDKSGRGSFAHTDFEHLLRLGGIKNLILAGVTTDVCVSTTMREANDRGFDCVVLEDVTAAATRGLHLSTLESVKMEGGIFGAVATSATLINALQIS